MTGRVFILEPAIDRSQRGHYLMSHKLLSRVLKNFEQYYVVGVDAENHISGINGALLPFFPRGFVRLVRKCERASRRSPGFLNSLIAKFENVDTTSFTKVISSLIAANKIRNTDHLVATSGSTTLVKILLSCLQQIPKDDWPHIHVRMFAQRFDDPTPDDDAVMFALEAAQSAAPGRINVYTETNALKIRLENRYRFLPIDTFLLPIHIMEGAIAKTKPPTTVFNFGFFGPVRRDKGAERLVSIITDLINLRQINGLTDELRFTFQHDGSRRAQAVLAGVEQLTNDGFKVDILRGTLNEEKFTQAIRHCNALVLPYDARAYALRGSSLISDAASLQVPLVISRGMAMSEWIADGNGLSAVTNSDFASALIEIERNRDQFAIAAANASARLAKTLAKNPIVANICR